jgi:hypothetical protein
MNKQPPIDFDLTRKQFERVKPYIPSRTRSVTEAERRHEQPTGTLVLEQQVGGICMLKFMLEQEYDNPADLEYMTNLAAAAAIGGSYHGLAEHAPTMRSRLKSARIADDTADWRETRSGLKAKTLQGFEHGITLANQLVIAKRNRRPVEKLNRSTGRQLGSVSLHTTVLPIVGAPLGQSAYDIQYAVRERGLDLLDTTAAYADRIGALPSPAQLVDPDSPLSVDIRRHAPDAVFSAYEQTLEDFRTAA